MALITVIIPSYNHAKFLEKRLQSILNQSFQDFEVILLDDASTDDSWQIIEQYRHHPQVKLVVQNKYNSGSPFLQWKKGIELAQSDWIWIAESDDYCDTKFLEALTPALRDSSCVLAYSEIDWVDSDGELIKAALPAEEEWLDGVSFLRKNMLMQDHLVNAGMVIFRRQCATHVPEDWVRMKQAGDYWFWCHVAQQGKVYASGKSLSKFVRHNATRSSQYLYGPIHFQEHLATLNSMYQKSVFNKADIRKYLMEQIIGLETGRKFFSRESWGNTRQGWQWDALQIELEISWVEIKIKVLFRKINHWLKKIGNDK